jgi:phage FluMu protein Com
VEPSSLKGRWPIEERCLCGNLLAKVSPDGIEILCRRCKRVHRIPWPGERKEVSAPNRTLRS